MANCNFQTTREADGTYRHVCTVCGTKRSSATERYFRACGKAPAKRLGLGDRVAKLLAALGLTRRRYRWLRGRRRVCGGFMAVLVEMPPAEYRCCGCDSRQRWLNKIGKRLGL